MLSILNAIGVLLCIYVLISKKYRTKNKEVTLLFLCLNVIFIRRLWLVLDPSFTMTLGYTIVNYIALTALFLIMRIVKVDSMFYGKSIIERTIKIYNNFKKSLNNIYKNHKEKYKNNGI